MKFLSYFNLFLTIIAILLSFFVGFKLPEEMMRKIYIDYIYYILLFNVLFWLFSFIRTRTKSFFEDLASYWKNHKLAVFVALILVIIGSIVSKPDFRILADETNLLSVSQALYENRECRNYTSVLYYYFGFKNVIRAELDKRPALFPLTVSFIHSFTGYRPENIFIANIIAGFFSLLFIYHLISYKFGKFWGICGMLLLSSYPVFVLYYTSGGFEVFNLLFSLILFWLLIKFLKEPTAVYAECIFLFLPLISQTRYESVTAVFCVLPVVFLMLPWKEYLKFSYKLILTPLFFIPIAWLRILTFNIKALEAEDKGSAFSFDFFKANLEKAGLFFIGKDLAFGAVPIVTFVAIAGLIWASIDLIIGFFRRKPTTSEVDDSLKNSDDLGNTDSEVDISENEKTTNNTYSYTNIMKPILFWSSITLFYVFHAIIRFAFWGGDFTLRSSSRLAVIFLPIFVYFTVRFCYGLYSKFNVRKIYSLLCIICLLFAYLPVAGQNLGVRDLTLYREFRATREYLKEYLPNKNEYILVADRSNLYVPLKYNSISFDYLNDRFNVVSNNFYNRTYSYLIVAQLIKKDTNEPISTCRVPKELNLKTLYETQIMVNQYLRISECYFDPKKGLKK